MLEQWIFAVLILLPAVGLAGDNKHAIKDYGVRGHVFPIAEKSLLEVIKERLQAASKEGKLAELQAKWQERVRQKLARPVAPAGIGRTKITRVWTYDPAFVQGENIRDCNGTLIVKAGTRVNPLDSLAWGEPLLLIDGDDAKQIVWAQNKSGRIILVQGAPLELSERIGRWCYFDQGGAIVSRFNINNVPAIIEQEGRRLKITEVAI